jgi:TldD protein
VRVCVSVGATAADGDELSIDRILSYRSVEQLPDEATLLDLADQARDLLVAQLDAPRGEPYSGPVLLDGRAAAVFFHEVLGHRVEGHRMKLDDEGKTFLEYVGRPILPDFIDIYDDPTLDALAGEQLNGFYAYDDEGVPAQRAVIVDDGVFQGFLMSRSPLPDFPHTNGHGRRSTGKAPSSRMGNTIVQASQTVPREKLREMLKAEVRKQGLEYGLYIEEIAGGFTMTGRVLPNAFNVRAITSWKVYADGRPDELIRGVDLVGTPLVAFGNIVAAGDDQGVFNGTCGAGSGWVPVSAVSPTLLLREVELQLKEKGEDRPPLLPKPEGPPNGGQAAGGAR